MYLIYTKIHFHGCANMHREICVRTYGGDSRTPFTHKETPTRRGPRKQLGGAKTFSSEPNSHCPQNDEVPCLLLSDIDSCL